MAVETHRNGGVAVVTFTNGAVNAISARADIPRDLAAALRAADADASVRAIVLRGGGRMFCGGADIAEFDTEPLRLTRETNALLDAMEEIGKPIIACIHGMALGGGLELALAADHRVASADAKLALPEVTLGILPGAGGTQALPRLIGVGPAASIVASGRMVGATEALTLGLVDRVSETDPLPAALAFAEGDPGKRRLRAVIAAPDAAALEKLRKELAGKARFNPGVAAALDCVEAATRVSYADGLAMERKAFLSLVEGKQSRGLRHSFFGERDVARIPGLGEAKPRAIASVGIVGAGTMGTGIAAAMMDAGLPVILVEPDAAARERAQGRLRAIYDRQAQKTGRGEDFVAAKMALATMVADLSALAACDLVIEAVYENLAVKQEVFRKLDAVMKQGAILTSNTSTLDVNLIAAVTSRPESVVGLHFFSPANVMRLLEIVRADATAPDILATVMALAKRIRKVGVVAGVCDGFIGNRIFEEYLRQAYFLLDEGALPAQVDRAMEAWGMAMGPLRTMDLAGQDIGWAIRKRRASEQPDRPYSRIPDLICEMGRFGQKTGAGFYLYPEGARGPVNDPAIDALVIAESARLGVTRRAITDEEIVERCLLAMINEGAKILADGMAYRPVDIDIVYLTGYGMNAARGGPMFQADVMGLAKAAERLSHHAAGYQGWALDPAPLLLELAKSGRSFAALNTRAI